MKASTSNGAANQEGSEDVYVVDDDQEDDRTSLTEGSQEREASTPDVWITRPVYNQVTSVDNNHDVMITSVDNNHDVMVTSADNNHDVMVTSA
jgi:hypothetical protein